MRRHLSYANVAATLALVFSMSGGALAAKHYLVNSTKQINPKVLKALRGNKGATGPTGLEGREGLAGKGTVGLAGNGGATGNEGPTGKEGAPGATHVVMRYGTQFPVAPEHSSTSIAQCHPGEAVTGGGYLFPEGLPTSANYGVLVNRPSIEVTFSGGVSFPAPENGHAATGWDVSLMNNTGTPFVFQAYVQCASP